MLIRATIVTASLLIATAFIARASVPAQVTSGRLNDLPLVLEQWSGAKAAAWDEKIIAELGVDEYVHRVYRQQQSKRAVWLYVGFYGSQSEGDTIHSPLNCLPGAGWEPIERSTTQLRVRGENGSSSRVDVNQLVVEKGTERMVVVYWYQSQGRVVASEYASRLFTVFDSVRRNRSDGAIVRVIAPVSSDTSAAAMLATQFASELLPTLSGVLPL